MRVALLSAEYPPLPGGVGDYTRRLALALHEAELGVEVIASRTAASHPADGFPVHSVGGWGWGLLQALHGLLAATRPDLLHLQYQTGAYSMHPAITLLPQLAQRLDPPIPLIVTCHDLRLPYLLPKADALRRLVTGGLLRGADALIVTNGEDAARLRAELPGNRETFAARQSLAATVIPIGSNILPQPLHPGQREAWRARLGAAEGESLLGFFGLLNRSKGLDLLLRALSLLPTGVRLAIIGGEAGQSDPTNAQAAEEATRLIAALGLGARVQRTGQLAEGDVSLALGACDAVVLPFRDGASYRRGSLLAALAHGLPVVTTAPRWPLDPPLRDRVEALLVAGSEQELPHKLADAVRLLVADGSLRQRLGLHARELAAAFRWEAIAQRHLACYEELLTSAAPAGHRRWGVTPRPRCFARRR